MTAAERLICETLAERFPESAQASGGSALRMRIASSFPSIAGSTPDERENFLDAAERLEKAGIISLVWERFREGEELKTIVLTDPARLYAQINRSFPLFESNAARAAARNEARDSPAAPFFAWLADNLTPADATPLDGDGELSRLVADLATLTTALTIHAPSGILEGITPRALSVRLYSDSKRLERVIEKSRALFRRAERASVDTPDLSPVGRSYPETLVSGSLVFELDDGTTLGNESGIVIGLPLASALRVQRVTPARFLPNEARQSEARRRLLTVENKETFYALSARTVAVQAILYVGGHPNPAVQRLVSVFYRSGFELFHAGDLDIEGILILQELANAAKAIVTPLLMDRMTFDRYAAHTRPLEDNALKRAAFITDGTRELPGIEELLERILSTGRGLEQEVIEYEKLTPGGPAFTRGD